jgi:hypothetical protein
MPVLPGRATFLAAAVAVISLSAFPAPAGAALLDHHATYSVMLEGADPADVEGRAEILARRGCDQWNYVFFIDFTVGEGLEQQHVEIRQDFAEALTHAALAFRTRLAIGDTGASRVEGRVNFSDGEKPASVSIQRDDREPQNAELPPETIGQVQSILALTDALAQGVERAAFTIFDTRRLTARLVEAAAAADSMPGAAEGVEMPEGQSWPLVMTFKDSQNTDQRLVNLHETGIVSWFERSLGDGVTVTGQLTDLNLTEPLSCE